jgi:hypothetical protein
MQLAKEAVDPSFCAIVAKRQQPHESSDSINSKSKRISRQIAFYSVTDA